MHFYLGCRQDMSHKLIKRLITRKFSSVKMSNSLQDVVQKLNGFASVKTAEGWDNVGLLIEPATPKYVETSTT